MYLSCVAYIRLVVTQKSFVKCWRVMFAGRLLRDFPYGAVYVGVDSVLGDFFGRLFTDFDEFVANAPSFSSQANASSPSAAIRGVPEGAARGSPLVSLTCGHCKTG